MKNTDEVIIFNQDLGKRVEKLRKLRGMSREEFAEKTQLASAFIYHVEKGHNGISFYNAIQVAGALGVPLSYLISEDLLTENERLYESFLIATEMSSEKKELVSKIIRVIAEEM